MEPGDAEQNEQATEALVQEEPTPELSSQDDAEPLAEGAPAFRPSSTEGAPSDQDLLARARFQARCFTIYNRAKIKDLESALDARQRALFVLLPSLVHENDPAFPGTTNPPAPCRIRGYRAPQSLAEARRVALGKKSRRDLRASSSVMVAPSAEPAVEFLSIMGSGGSIAQTKKSDLDFWVCLADHVSADDGARLRRKLTALERWCDEFAGIEAHFFLTSAERLRRNDYGEVDGESCGTAQAKLLKEEYYRAHVVVAGRRPLWWLVAPGASHQEYDRLRDLAAEDPDLRRDYLDIGHLAGISKGEFLGGGLWQQNKGLGSPFKSVLKMALLYEYFDETRPTPLLCDELKARVLEHPNRTDTGDAYQMLFDRVDRCFAEIRDEYRALIRECFYLKIAPRLTELDLARRHLIGRRVVVMLDYMQRWALGAGAVARLDRFQEWRFQDLVAFRDRVNAFMTWCMRLIRQELKSQQVGQAVSERDLKVLLGRLMVAYDMSKPHKLDWLPQVYRKRVSGESFTLRENVSDATPDAGWELLTGQVESQAPAPQRHEVLARRSTLPELLAWMFLNKFFSTGMPLFILASRRLVLEKNVRALFRELAAFFRTIDVTAVPADAYLDAPHRERVFFVINLTEDPEDPTLRQNLDAREDVLNYGANRRCLAREITVLSLNSHGEFFCVNVAGEECLAQAVRCALDRDYLRRGDPDDPYLSVFAGESRFLTPPLRARLERLFEQIGECFLDHEPRNVQETRFVLEVGGRVHSLGFDGEVFRFGEFATRDEFFKDAARNTSRATRTRFDRANPRLLRYDRLAQESRPGVVTVFIHPKEIPVSLVIFDELGGIHRLTVAPPDLKPYLQKLYVFLRNICQRCLLRHEFTMFALTSEDTLVRLIEVSEGDDTATFTDVTERHHKTFKRQFYSAETLAFQRALTDEGEAIDYYVLGNDVLSKYSCEHGLVAEVVRRVLARRSGGDLYPIFLTDVDFSEDYYRRHPGRFVTVAEFLVIKNHIEARLNEYLGRIARRLALTGA